MLALVLAQTLRYGSREGCKVAVTPLLTDAPIIVVALVFAAKLAEFRALLGIVSIAGAAFVLSLAWESFTPVRAITNAPAERPGSWSKGIITNLLNPHPWLFWLTVGSAILARTITRSYLEATAFLAGFYLLLIGSKVIVALLAGRSRSLLTGRPYEVAMRVLGLLLVVLAVLLLRDGLKQLAVI
jgi:threonine/homoserine/homoserine lactone efflux protein